MTGKDGTGWDILVEAGLGGDGGAVADGEMAGEADLAGEGDVASEGGAAGDAGARGDRGMSADDHVVSHLDLIIQLYAIPDDRILDGAAIDVIATEIPLGEAIAAAADLMAGKVRGRIVVDVNR